MIANGNPARFGIIIAALTGLLLTACDGGQDDLGRYISEVKARPATPIPPIPTVRTYTPYTYEGLMGRDPFRTSTSEGADQVGCAVKPVGDSVVAQIQTHGAVGVGRTHVAAPPVIEAETEDPTLVSLLELIEAEADIITCGLIMAEFFQGIRRRETIPKLESYFREMTCLQPREPDTYLAAAALFLLADVLGKARGETQDRLVAGRHGRDVCHVDHAEVHADPADQGGPLAVQKHVGPARQGPGPAVGIA